MILISNKFIEMKNKQFYITNFIQDYSYCCCSHLAREAI